MANQPSVNAVDELRRTAAVAADYTQLQGLINATTGVGLIVWALGSQTWGAIIVAIGVPIWSTYYRNRFGRAVGRSSVLVSVALVFAALGVCAVGYVADGLLSWPVLVLPVLAAGCLVVGFVASFTHVGVTWFHWAAVGFLLVSAFAPLLGLDLLGAGTGVFALGVALVVIGLADHLRLVRTMRPVPRD